MEDGCVENRQYFEYGLEEVEFLKKRDPVLAKAIDEIGHIYRVVIPDMFMALINSIIGQQISTKAQDKIWLRFLAMFEPITPQSIAVLSVEAIQACGLSRNKAVYIKEIAQTIVDGSLDLEALQTMADDDVVKRLSQIKGVGVWTAEMLMIFSMQRPDVISLNDMAIIRGLRMLYRHRQITPKLFAKYKKRYSPYATIASLYLWQISHGACDGLVDLAQKSAPNRKA